MMLLLTNHDYQCLVVEYGTDLIKLGLFQPNPSFFFSSFRLLLGIPISEDLKECYAFLFNIAANSLNLFPKILFRKFWARLSNFQFDGNRGFVEIAFNFLNNISLKIDKKEILLYYLCNQGKILNEEQIACVIQLYIDLMVELDEYVDNLMENLFYSMISEQVFKCIDFIISKIEILFNDDNVIIASYLFYDILVFRPKSLLPYISTLFLPIIEKMITESYEVYELFSVFLKSTICNSIDYYDFFNRIFVILVTPQSPYSIRIGCYDVIKAFGDSMNALAGWLFPLLLQQIDGVPPNDVIFFLESVFSTFNPSLVFSDENSQKLLIFLQMLLQNENDRISLKAACFVFKLMIMHNDVFGTLFPVSLEIINNNPEENCTYDTLRQYIKYFGSKYIEDQLPSIITAANNFLTDPSRFLCAASILKYCPEKCLKMPKIEDFFQSIVINNQVPLGKPENLEMISHVRFGSHFIRFYATIHQKIRQISFEHNDILFGLCKICRKMVEHIPDGLNIENIARCVHNTFLNIMNKTEIAMILQNSDILAEIGIALAILHIDSVHVVLNTLLLHASESMDFDLLLNSMRLFEKCLKYGIVNDEEMSQILLFAGNVMTKMPTDIHLTQLFNMVALFPPESITALWQQLICFWNEIRIINNNFICTKSVLAAIICHHSALFPEFALPLLLIECIDQFPPIERRRSEMFVRALITFATNPFQAEINAKAFQALQTYSCWNPNRTKFYKISKELDDLVAQVVQNRFG